MKKIPPLRLVAIAGVTLAVLCAVTVSLVNFMTRTSREYPAVYPEEVLGVTVHTALLEDGLEANTGIHREMNTVQYIVIHETANTSDGADAACHNTYLQSGESGSTGWHYTVDDHEIYHNLPDDVVGYHAGDGLTENGGNLCGIGIELCVNADGDYEATLDNAAKLTAWLLRAYYMNVKQVKQHADFMDKNCPMLLRDQGRWEEFLGLVEQYYKCIP